MSTAREALDAIRANIEGELLAVAIREGELSPEEEQNAMRQALNAGIWDALYELAARIDRA